ncbi:MAG: outer membrane protein assembly factor BamB family protein [Deltaproteobacteria bacterium]
MTYDTQNGGSPLTRSGTLDFQTGDPANPTAAVPLTATVQNNVAYAPGWPKWHHDNGNTGLTTANTGNLTGSIAWKYFVGVPPTVGFCANATCTSRICVPSTYINSPVVDGQGNVYQVGMNATGLSTCADSLQAYGTSSTLYSISAAGAQNWATSVSQIAFDPHPSTPAILASGNLEVAAAGEIPTPSGSTAPSVLYDVTGATGAIVAQQPFGEDGFDGSPGVGNDGTLFEGDDDGLPAAGGLPALGTDPYDLLAFKIQANGQFAPVGQIQLPFYNGKQNGSERFGVTIGSDDTSFWCNDGQCLALSPPGSGFAPLSGWPSGGVTVSAGDSTTISGLDGLVVGDLAVDFQNTGNVYAYGAWEDCVKSGKNVNCTVQGVIDALSPTSGAILWSTPLPAAALPASVNIYARTNVGNASPAIVQGGGTVYVGNGDGLRAIAATTGSVSWLFPSANVTSSPAIGGDGTIFFGTQDGTFYAVHPNGTIRFSLATGGTISSSPAIGPDGTVFFVSDDGNLYAVH